MSIVVVGNSNREEAVAEALRKRGSVVVTVPWTTIPDIVRFATEQKAHLVFIGSEEPLAAGVVDELTRQGFATVGPTAAAAQLETDKGFLHALTARLEQKTIRLPRSRMLTDMGHAERILRTEFPGPVIIKKTGLHRGKGVIIAETTEEALRAVKEGLQDGRVQAQEKLVGTELELFFLCGDKTAIYFGSAVDYKRLYDGDQGPMTGGMGAYSPAELVTDAFEQEVRETIVTPILNAMHEMAMPFRGIMFVQLMLVAEGGKSVPYVIEINVRLGNPEAQVLLPRIADNVDLAQYFLASTKKGGLKDMAPITFKTNKVVGVVQATRDYPNGGKRAHTRVGEGATYDEAARRAYDTAIATDPGGEYHYRSDIAAHLR